MTFLNSSNGRWLIVGTLAILGLIALTLRMFADDPAAPPPGTIRIASAAPALAPALPVDSGAAATPQKMAPIPIQPTETSGRKASQQASLLLLEDRDTGWASRSEAALKDFTRTIPYIGGGRLVLTITCKSSTCEVNGLVEPDPATGTMNPVWEALERDTSGPELRAHGLERTAAIFDTGRGGDEFKIYYRRTADPVAE